ncbi:hypothetical protein GCM10010423_27240 [Streptomyces levis]|uniref:Uncharacterized protein n=1 Tax=Streptomyces levis TaxID=285566 RepID=A0ABN3NQ42_9ACTN
MVDNVSPVIAMVTDGKGGEAPQPVLERLRGRDADLVVIGPEHQVEQASAGFVPPTQGVTEEVQPVLEIIPLQLLGPTSSPSPAARTRTHRTRRRR